MSEIALFNDSLSEVTVCCQYDSESLAFAVASVFSDESFACAAASVSFAESFAFTAAFVHAIKASDVKITVRIML
jgi:hypothetical protein